MSSLVVGMLPFFIQSRLSYGLQACQCYRIWRNHTIYADGIAATVGYLLAPTSRHVVLSIAGTQNLIEKQRDPYLLSKPLYYPRLLI